MRQNRHSIFSITKIYQAKALYILPHEAKELLELFCH